MSEEFLAKTLNSKDLMALLFASECKRKNQSPTPELWKEFLDIFAERLGNLREELRFEVLEAHLMSVEDLDVYHDESLKNALDLHAKEIQTYKTKLNEDTRF